MRVAVDVLTVLLCILTLLQDRVSGGSGLEGQARVDGLVLPQPADPAVRRVVADEPDALLPRAGHDVEVVHVVAGSCDGGTVVAVGHEGDVAGLGLLPGRVSRLRGGPGLRVPHMGWSTLRATRADALVDGVDGAQAYFVHSFAAPVTDDCVLAGDHGQAFAAAVRRGRIAGTQFHPERSAAVGARVLRNFLSPAFEA